MNVLSIVVGNLDFLGCYIILGSILLLIILRIYAFNTKVQINQTKVAPDSIPHPSHPIQRSLQDFLFDFLPYIYQPYQNYWHHYLSILSYQHSYLLIFYFSFGQNNDFNNNISGNKPSPTKANTSPVRDIDGLGHDKNQPQQATYECKRPTKINRIIQLEHWVDILSHFIALFMLLFGFFFFYLPSLQSTLVPCHNHTTSTNCFDHRQLPQYCAWDIIGLQCQNDSNWWKSSDFWSDSIKQLLLLLLVLLPLQCIVRLLLDGLIKFSFFVYLYYITAVFQHQHMKRMVEIPNLRTVTQTKPKTKGNISTNSKYDLEQGISTSPSKYFMVKSQPMASITYGNIASDELQGLQSRWFLTSLALKYQIMQKSIDFLPITNEINLLLQHQLYLPSSLQPTTISTTNKSFSWQAKPKSFYSQTCHMYNYLCFQLQSIQYQSYLPISLPLQCRHLMNHYHLQTKKQLIELPKNQILPNLTYEIPNKQKSELRNILMYTRTLSTQCSEELRYIQCNEYLQDEYLLYMFYIMFINGFYLSLRQYAIYQYKFHQLQQIDSYTGYYYQNHHNYNPIEQAWCRYIRQYQVYLIRQTSNQTMDRQWKHLLNWSWLKMSYIGLIQCHYLITSFNLTDLFIYQSILSWSSLRFTQDKEKDQQSSPQTYFTFDFQEEIFSQNESKESFGSNNNPNNPNLQSVHRVIPLQQSPILIYFHYLLQYSLMPSITSTWKMSSFVFYWQLIFFVLMIMFFVGIYLLFNQYQSLSEVETIHFSWIYVIYFLLLHIVYQACVVPIVCLFVYQILPLFHHQEFDKFWVILIHKLPIALSKPSSSFLDIHSLIQHFHPICRVARNFPHLMISRFLFNIHDYTFIYTNLTKYYNPMYHQYAYDHIYTKRNYYDAIKEKQLRYQEQEKIRQLIKLQHGKKKKQLQHHMINEQELANLNSQSNKHKQEVIEALHSHGEVPTKQPEVKQNKRNKPWKQSLENQELLIPKFQTISDLKGSPLIYDWIWEYYYINLCIFLRYYVYEYCYKQLILENALLFWLQGTWFLWHLIPKSVCFCCRSSHSSKIKHSLLITGNQYYLNQWLITGGYCLVYHYFYFYLIYDVIWFHQEPTTKSQLPEKQSHQIWQTIVLLLLYVSILLLLLDYGLQWHIYQKIINHWLYKYMFVYEKKYGLKKKKNLYKQFHV